MNEREESGDASRFRRRPVNIALIASYGHPLALGLRYVSASLARQGHDVRMLFLTTRRNTAEAAFPPKLLDEIAAHVRDAGLIGVSLMTNTFHRARALTEAIRARGINVPVVWGGIHPTVAPEESLETADIVCVGEGEQAMAELAEAVEAGRDPTNIHGLWFRRDKTILRNPVRRLNEDLDALPFPDYDMEGRHFVVKGDSIVPARPKLLRGVLDRYRMQSTRGCPYRCTFCNNATQRRVYEGMGGWVRTRSNESVIAEIRARIAGFPTIQAINIVDDLFLVRTEEQLAEFVRLYREHVNLPLEFDAFPNLITPEKIRLLRQIPLALVSMGIQSGSPDTLQNLYQRPTPIAKIARAIDLLADNGIPAEYHYIVNNPFEPDANLIETLRFAARHHRGPAIPRVFPLALYPHTPLHERAVAEGLIHDRHEEAYQQTFDSHKYFLGESYLTIVLRAVLGLKGMGLSASFAERFVNVATAPVVRWTLDRRWLPYAAFGLFRAGQVVHRRIIRQCILKPVEAVRRLLGMRRRTGRDVCRQPVC